MAGRHQAVCARQMLFLLNLPKGHGLESLSQLTVFSSCVRVSVLTCRIRVYLCMKMHRYASVYVCECWRPLGTETLGRSAPVSPARAFQSQDSGPVAPQVLSSLALHEAG